MKLRILFKYNERDLYCKDLNILLVNNVSIISVIEKWWSNLTEYFEKILPAANIYLLKVNNKNTRKRCEICSKLTIKTPERRHWCRSGAFILDFEQVIVSWAVHRWMLEISNLRCTNTSTCKAKSTRDILNKIISTGITFRKYNQLKRLETRKYQIITPFQKWR